MKLLNKIVDGAMKMAGALSQAQDHHNPVKSVTEGMPALLRSAAARGAVLLQNNGVLPLQHGTKIALFGRCQMQGFYTGYGSGGDVNFPYTVSIYEGIQNCPGLKLDAALAEKYRAFCQENPVDDQVWGLWPRFFPEMPLTEEILDGVEADQAVVVIGRSAGEDRENVRKPGSFYLTEEEKHMLHLVTAKFPEAVLLLNIGAVMDLSFLEEYPLGAVLVLWQGGMEMGNAAADLLTGKENPSGRLTDTVALTYEDYPSADCFGGFLRNEYREDIYVGYRYFETFAKDKVRFPFGHGLSYTKFALDCRHEGLRFYITVTNIGVYPGRETALLYVKKPCGMLGAPERELVAFGKTAVLAPGESQELLLTVPENLLAVFDDCGLAGAKNAWVIVPGTYEFYLGGDVRNALIVAQRSYENPLVVQRVQEAAAPKKSFPILARQEMDGDYIRIPRRAAAATVDLARRIERNLPKEIFPTGDKGYKLADVQRGEVSLDAFVAQLSNEELEAISRGGYIMNHPLGAKGNAGIYGGVTESLRQKGVPVIVTTDGPSGIRLYDSCSLLPIGTSLACSFDEGLMEQVFSAVGAEMVAKGSDVLLAPGMNIHRNPLCGRNFEYFSEDPLLTGKIAAAQVRGLQSQLVSACPKHFACNNQEFNRRSNDSVVSQRALREIYLRGFEICVKEASPRNIMTSYNKINGVWAHYHYDLVATILRGEWGYQGNVITDWWMQYRRSPEFPKLRSNAYRVRARVDVLMPGGRYIDPGKRPDGTLLATLGKEGGITLGELQQCAKGILQHIIDWRQL